MLEPASAAVVETSSDVASGVSSGALANSYPYLRRPEACLKAAPSLVVGVEMLHVGQRGSKDVAIYHRR